ncbi:MAG: alpha-ketoglutarate-dependent dioxygenase AlkB [Brevundimonas sp.]|nr:alpha-ketoglutarate-dependent dioxygenase AlkB [Brevundimonas sp.]
MTSTLSLFDDAPAGPAGFGYAPDLMTAAEEQDLIGRFSSLPFAPFDFRGFQGHRRTVPYGSRYDFTRSLVKSADPIPDWLISLRSKAASWANLTPDDLGQALITEYAPGAGIGWRRDRPEYGAVLDVSFATPCVLRMRRPAGEGRWTRAALPLAPDPFIG